MVSDKIKTINAQDMRVISLGRRGENAARRIQFDVSGWISTYGPGTVQLVHRRATDAASYPVSLQVEDNAAFWIVSNADTDVVGRGRCELSYHVGDTIVKSKVWPTETFSSLDNATGPAPDPEQGWVDQVLAAATKAEEAAKRAENALAGIGSGGGGSTPSQPGTLDKSTILAALGYTPANQEKEDARPSERIMSESGGESVSVTKDDGVSLVDKLATLGERGVYTLYVQKGVPDNPAHAAEINSSLRGICDITLTGPENGYMYAWILLFDKEGNLYTRYTSDTSSTWTMYQKEKELQLVADLDFSAGDTLPVNLTGLDDVTEIYLVADVASAVTDDRGGISISINGTAVAKSALIVYKQGEVDYGNRNQYVEGIYNGVFWMFRAVRSFSGNDAATFGASVTAPNGVVADVGKATTLQVRSSDATHAPATGTLKMWVR